MARQRAPKTLVPPSFPDTMPTDPTLDDVLGDRASFEQRLWIDARFEQQCATDVYLEYIHAKRTSFQQAELPLLQSADCRFDGCDFVGATLDKAHLRRSEFISCRLTGIKLIDADLEDVLFTRCTCNLAQLWTSKYTLVRFEHCSFHEAAFDGSDLSGVVFYKCDLSKADFRNTKLKGTDFRGSAMEGVQISSKELPGAIIDPTQAILLAELLGVIVRPEDA